MGWVLGWGKQSTSRRKFGRDVDFLLLSCDYILVYVCNIESWLFIYLFIFYDDDDVCIYIAVHKSYLSVEEVFQFFSE